MSLVYSSNLSESEKDSFKRKLREKSEVIGHCRIWKGTLNRDGYGILRCMFRGKRITLTVHRLNYFLCSHEITLDKNIHVSHLCHQRNCLKISHLSYEPAQVNIHRNMCALNKVCRGHHGYPKCIFH